MKRYLLASAMMVLGAIPAHASDISLGIGINQPGYYEPAPVYYAPAPVYYESGPGRQYHNGWDRHRHYDWGYWNNDRNDHDNHRGHWDNGRHEGQRDDHRDNRDNGDNRDGDHRGVGRR